MPSMGVLLQIRRCLVDEAIGFVSLIVLHNISLLIVGTSASTGLAKSLRESPSVGFNHVRIV
jgi:hypothetical protein